MRRPFLAAALLLPLAACASPRTNAIASRGDRMVRWLQTSGRDNMMAPEALALMGIVNDGLYVRDIPVRQLAADGPAGRYVVSLVNIRKIHEFVFHRRQGDTLILHLSNLRFARQQSVIYPQNGKPSVIADSAFAESDFQQQVAFWFDRMPGR